MVCTNVRIAQSHMTKILQGSVVVDEYLYGATKTESRYASPCVCVVTHTELYMG